MSSKQFVFPLDKKKFSSKPLMYAYIEENYSNMLSEEISPARLYFNLKYNKTEGKSVISGKPTPWNEVTERYERFADEEERKQYRQLFRSRMIKKYGKDHILDEPEQQKLMLQNRSISKEYKWGNGETSVVNSLYEFDFLNFVEGIYHFNKSCFTEPPTIYYKDGDNMNFYLPDFYIPSLNLIVEVKGSNGHYQNRDSYKEKLKASATIKEGFNFIQINDRNYTPFNIFFKKQVLDN